MLDTNILVYCFDKAEPEKQERSLEVIARLAREAAAALPAQVLVEFSNVALRRLKPPMSPGEVLREIELYEYAFPIIPLTPDVVREALRGVRDHSFSYYDAQIWAVARLEGIPVVLSEDFPVDSTVEGHYVSESADRWISHRGTVTPSAPLG